jgi:Lectin C-type domain
MAEAAPQGPRVGDSAQGMSFCAWLAAGSICAILPCATGGCADVLDIPDNPRVLREAIPSPAESTSTMDAPRDAAPEPPVLNAGEAELMVTLFEPGTGGPESPALAAPDPVAEAPDGGGDAAEIPGLALDAGVPALDAGAPAAPTCEVTQILGPNGNCFLAVATPLSWLAARLNCQTQGEGWDLAVIRDEIVDDFVAQLSSDEAWIGASDAETEGAWLWVDDTSPFWSGSLTGSAVSGAYENWFILDPNGGIAADCARLVPELGSFWADAACAEPYSSVCEGPAE